MTTRFNEQNRTLTNEANKILGVDANSTLPAIDGSQITNLTASSATNNRTLTFGGSFSTVTTVNVARNTIYGVSTSGPQFTITSGLRTSYVDGDLIYVIVWASNTWCNFVNSDTAGGTKLFVEGTETTNWGRTSSTHQIFKLRLTTHTDGKLYIHLTDDLKILDDFEDVEGTRNATIGQVLKYKPGIGKWLASYNFAPKVLVLDDTNIHNYVSQQSGGTYPNNLFSSLSMDFEATFNQFTNDVNPNSIPILWSDFIKDDNYEHYYIIIQATNMTTRGQITNITIGECTCPISHARIMVYLPTISDGMIGKKITFLWDLPDVTRNETPYLMIHPSGAKPSKLYNYNWDTQRAPDYMDGQFNIYQPTTFDQQGYVNMSGGRFAYAVIGAGEYTKVSSSFVPITSPGSYTFMAVDGIDIPTNPGTGGLNAPQSYKRRWVSVLV